MESVIQPKPAEEVGNKEAKANVTDPDSRIMKTRNGFVQGLNAQAVTTEQQIIVAEDVTQEANDKQQLHPMLEQAEENRQAVEREEEMGVALADAGYCSQENFTKKPTVMLNCWSQHSKIINSERPWLSHCRRKNLYRILYRRQN